MTCPYGYELQGDNQLKCGQDGKWQGSKTKYILDIFFLENTRRTPEHAFSIKPMFNPMNRSEALRI